MTGTTTKYQTTEVANPPNVSGRAILGTLACVEVSVWLGVYSYASA